MPLIKRGEREKKAPFRDATLFIIICEGSKREPEYFNYFDRLSSRVKVRAIGTKDGKSAPKHLEEIATKILKKNDENDGGEIDMWMVLDIDRWELEAIHSIKKFSGSNNCNLVFSNPCFEVWLNFHFSTNQPDSKKESCKAWKAFLDTHRSFDHDSLPSLIKTAIDNSQVDFKENGYLPCPGSTQVFRLGERIYPLVEKEL